MGVFDHFPYTNFHELNLDWILAALKEIQITMDQFVLLNSLKYADPIQWDITRQYEKNTIVIEPLTGTAYISVQPVPVGVDISRPEYWSVVFDLGRISTSIGQNFTVNYESAFTTTATMEILEGQWVVWNEVLYIALTDIHQGTAYAEGTNIRHITVEEVKNDIYAFFNTMIGALTDLNTTDKSSIVNAINEVLGVVGALTDLTTTDQSSIVNAINEIVTNIGALTDLNTTDKSSIVNAVNEVLSDINAVISTIGDLNDITSGIANTSVVDALNDVYASIDTLIDAKLGVLSDLTTTNKTTAVDAINEVNGNIGNLASLTTTDQSSIVNAINELVTSIGGLSDKLYYITPEQFGAVGDGVTNDYQAINDAIDFAVSNSHMIASQFPEGAIWVIFTKDYLYSGTPYDLTGKYGVSLFSAKHGAVIRCNQGFLKCVNAGANAQGVRGLTIDGLTLICNSNATVLKLHKPRNTIIRNTVIRSDLNLNQATGIETCATVDFQILQSTFYELNTGISLINDSYITQSTTMLVDGCRFSTCTYGINANYNNTNSYIKNLNVINSIFEQGTTGIRVISGAYVSHLNVTNCHFEMYLNSAVTSSRGTMYFDESNFIYIGTNSAGLKVYIVSDIDDSAGHSANYIVVPDNAAINNLVADIAADIRAPYHSRILTPDWSIDTFHNEYEIRGSNTLNLTALFSGGSLYEVTTEFRAPGGCYFGYAWHESGSWHAHQDGGNITGMTLSSAGVYTAPVAGAWTIRYN